jgi:peptidoglycan/LPS O-acetylase OafA/YrhL
MTSFNTKNKTQRILFLDWLRIFAFSSVLSSHFFYLDLSDQLTNPYVSDIVKIALKMILPFMSGGTGVTVFFLVSGYIITHILREQRPLEFVIKRIFRIYPLYIACVLITYAIAGTRPDFAILIPQLLLMGDLFHTPYALTGVEWTLRVEMMFYLIMLTFKLGRGFDKRKHILPWLLVCAVTLANYLSPFPSWTAINNASYSIAFQFLFLGAVIYLFEVKWVNWPFFIGFICLVFYDSYNLTDQYQPHLKNDPYMALAFMIFMLIWLLRNRLKENKSMLFFSNLTFAVYLTHTTIHDIWELVGQKYFHITSKLVFNLSLIALLFLICYLMYRWIEKPFNRLGQVLSIKLSISK